MNTKLKIYLRSLCFICISFTLLACPQSEEVSSQSVASNEKSELTADRFIAEAKAQLLKANQAKFEWTTTEPLITLAVNAKNNGEHELAIELAKKAILESNNALLQAKYSDNHWQDHAIN